MNNFKKNIDLFFTELMQSGLKKLRETDENYEDIYRAHVKVSEKYEQVLESLNSKDKEFMENYKDDLYSRTEIEQEWLYLQGYKDCMKFLKLIEAI